MSARPVITVLVQDVRAAALQSPYPERLSWSDCISFTMCGLLDGVQQYRIESRRCRKLCLRPETCGIYYHNKCEFKLVSFAERSPSRISSEVDFPLAGYPGGPRHQAGAFFYIFLFMSEEKKETEADLSLCSLKTCISPINHRIRLVWKMSSITLYENYNTLQ